MRNIFRQFRRHEKRERARKSDEALKRDSQESIHILYAVQVQVQVFGRPHARGHGCREMYAAMQKSLHLNCIGHT